MTAEQKLVFDIIKNNYKILLIILFTGIIFHFLINNILEDPDNFDFYDVMYIISPIIVASLCFIIAKTFWSQVLGWSYFALGIAFIFYFLGETTWIYYEVVLQEYPYPSIADVFYFLKYPFMAIHLIINIRYFGLIQNTVSRILIFSITSIIILTYTVLCLDYFDESMFDFLYGEIFIVSSGIVFALSVLGTFILRNSIFGSIWIILTTGVSLFTIADVWYYYTEVTSMFDNTHPSNTLWIIGYMTISFALIKHYKEVK